LCVCGADTYIFITTGLSPANRMFNELRIEKKKHKRRGRPIRQSKVEERYRDILAIQEDHVSTLRGYAQFLYQKKKENKKANRHFALALKTNPLHRTTLAKYALFLDTGLEDEAKAHR